MTYGRGGAVRLPNGQLLHPPQPGQKWLPRILGFVYEPPQLTGPLLFPDEVVAARAAALTDGVVVSRVCGEWIGGDA